jgi:hypothetical protein
MENGGLKRAEEAKRTGLEVLRKLPNETLKGRLSDEEVCALLVLPDLTESDRAGPEPVRLLYSSGEGALLGGLGGHLARGLASGGLHAWIHREVRNTERRIETVTFITLRAVCLVRAMVMVGVGERLSNGRNWYGQRMLPLRSF